MTVFIANLLCTRVKFCVFSAQITDKKEENFHLKKLHTRPERIICISHNLKLFIHGAQLNKFPRVDELIIILLFYLLVKIDRNFAASTMC